MADPTSPDASPASPRVLVVDDEPEMARAMTRVLRRAGFEAIFATNGFQAGSLLHTFQPALMTLDIQMPWIDGLDVLRLLRDAPPPFPLKVLVVSADRRLNEALAAGASAVLAKPFTNDDLLAAVEGAIRPAGTRRNRS